MSDATIIALGDCIRCGRLFQFDPETVPSTSVHPETLCPVRPDGTRVKPGDADAMREPLCGPCAGVFGAAGGADRPLAELFPRANVDRIDVAAAVRIQAEARSRASAATVWAATRRAGINFHAFTEGEEPRTTRCGRSTLSVTSITLTEEQARNSLMEPCPRCYPQGGAS